LFLISSKMSPPLAAISTLTEVIENSNGERLAIRMELQVHFLLADTMFELVKALNDGAEVLKCQTPNPISPNAGCKLFITFVTLFPHNSVVRFRIYFYWPAI